MLSATMTTNDGPSKVVIDFKSVPKSDANSIIKKMFLVNMPDDFHLFWDFAKTINHEKPSSAFTRLLEWTLVGPFDVLSGQVKDLQGFSKEKLLCHCRYYYDPPEFQTVIIKKDADLTHFGYYRDEPDQKNPLVVSNCAAKGGQIQAMGDNLFTLLKWGLDEAILTLSQSSQETKQTTVSEEGGHRLKQHKGMDSSNTKQSSLEKVKELEVLRDKLLDYCQSNNRHEIISCESWSKTKTRKAKCVAKTLNQYGIVVPMDDDVGYRNLGMTDKKLLSILDRISKFNDEDKTRCGHYNELYQLITNANMANDECDFGMGLELGLDLFFNGDKFFHKHVESLLTNAYTLLDRNEFLEILNAHLADRKKGARVSLLLDQ